MFYARSMYIDCTMYNNKQQINKILGLYNFS